MSKYFISLSLIFGSVAEEAGAQQTPIQTDRPDQTECPATVPKYYLQAENGFLLEWKKAGQHNFASPSTLWKYGIGERVELRLITEWITEKENGETRSGLAPVTIGFKAKLCEEKGLRPAISFIGHLTTRNIGSGVFATSYAAPSFRFTLQHNLSDRLSLGYNLGAGWDGETANPVYLYTVTTGFATGKKTGAYIELYGYSAKGFSADHRFDGGFTWTPTADILADVSGGIGLSGHSPTGYIALGISYQIRLKNK